MTELRKQYDRNDDDYSFRELSSSDRGPISNNIRQKSEVSKVVLKPAGTRVVSNEIEQENFIPPPRKTTLVIKPKDYDLEMKTEHARAIKHDNDLAQLARNRISALKPKDKGVKIKNEQITTIRHKNPAIEVILKHAKIIEIEEQDLEAKTQLTMPIESDDENIEPKSGHDQAIKSEYHNTEPIYEHKGPIGSKTQNGKMSTAPSANIESEHQDMGTDNEHVATIKLENQDVKIKNTEHTATTKSEIPNVEAKTKHNKTIETEAETPNKEVDSIGSQRPVQDQLPIKPSPKQPFQKAVANQSHHFTQNQVPIISCKSPPFPLVLEAYNNLFRTYYSLLPTISTTSLSHALTQISILLYISTIYNSLHLLRPYILSVLFSFGRSLWESIASDPLRWLLLATKLRCAPMFKESMIHLVGRYPAWPSDTIRRGELPEEVVICYMNKVEEMKELKARVDEVLFTLSLRRKGREIPMVLGEGDANQRQFVNWSVRNIWRDWFGEMLLRCGQLRRSETPENRDGEIYRLIDRAEDAYLPLDEVVETLKSCCHERKIAEIVRGERVLGFE